MRQIAERGLSGSGGALPGLDTIQSSFGKHDVSQVTAYSGAAAHDAADTLGAKAFASGDNVAFAGATDLHTAAHEAAHVVQQRHGSVPADGVGHAGDSHEQHADAVADRVTAGQSTEPLLDGIARGGAPSLGVQLDRGDEGLVEFIKMRGVVAQAAYDLLERQAEQVVRHIDLISFYTDGVLDEQNPQVKATKDEIFNKSGTRRTGSPRCRASARRRSLSQSGTAMQRRSLLPMSCWCGGAKSRWMATKLVALSQAKVASTLVSVKEHAVKMAHLALAAHEQNMMRGLLEVADAAAPDADQGDDSVTRLNDMLQGTDRVKASANEFLALETTIGDSLNNATTGLAFGLVGALDAGKVFTLSASASSGLGVFGGTPGIFFGSIGLLLGVKNAILGAMAKSRLETAKGNLSTGTQFSDAVKYAIGQKRRRSAVTWQWVVAAPSRSLLACSH